MTLPAPTASSGSVRVTSGDLSRYFIRLGTFGFGGPIALTAAMHRDLVDTRAWVTTEEYRQGLALAAARAWPAGRAARHVHRLGSPRCVGGHHRRPGVRRALLSHGACLLSACYLRFGGLAWMQGVFYGIGAAVIAIVARGALKLLGAPWAGICPVAHRRRQLRGLVVWAEAEILWVFAASGLAGLLVSSGESAGRVPGAVAAALVPWWLVTGLDGPASTGRWPGSSASSPRRPWLSSAVASPWCRSCTGAWFGISAG